MKITYSIEERPADEDHEAGRRMVARTSHAGMALEAMSPPMDQLMERFPDQLPEVFKSVSANLKDHLDWVRERINEAAA